MEKGNLDNIIYDQMVDDWTLSNRIDILVSVASGLSYLHSGYDFPIVHCDLKPSNILLDENMEAHVSDFGTARMLGIHLQDGSSISSASVFEGTIGYLAPEFAYMRKVTTKVDVFSFGVIVMEIITKRRPTGLTGADELPMTLHQIVQNAAANGINELIQIVDPNLASYVSKKQDVVEGLLKLALSCTSPDPEDRPDMEQVLSSLSKLRKMECMNSHACLVKDAI
nr:PREDICTED: LRR receptor-like serine/threonine-protein kinase FLS2 [Nicotiana tabacum]